MKCECGRELQAFGEFMRCLNCEVYYRADSEGKILKLRIDAKKKLVVFKVYEHPKANQELTMFRHQMKDAGFRFIEESLNKKEYTRKSNILRKIWKRKKANWNEKCRMFCVICENILKTPEELKQGFHNRCFERL